MIVHAGGFELLSLWVSIFCFFFLPRFALGSFFTYLEDLNDCIYYSSPEKIAYYNNYNNASNKQWLRTAKSALQER